MAFHFKMFPSFFLVFILINQYLSGRYSLISIHCTLINETCSITHDPFTKQELPSVIFRQSLPFHDEQSYRNIFDTQRLISGRATFSAIRCYSFFPRTLSQARPLQSPFDSTRNITCACNCPYSPHRLRECFSFI